MFLIKPIRPQSNEVASRTKFANRTRSETSSSSKEYSRERFSLVDDEKHDECSLSLSLSLCERGRAKHVRGVDTDRDRYRFAARELKRDCAISESFSRFDQSRLETAIHGLSFQLITQPKSFSGCFSSKREYYMNI